MAGVLQPLEADLRHLAAESRRPDSFAGSLTGWLAGPEHPALKESVERGLAELRSLGAGTPEDGLKAALTESQAVAEPFLLACESKSPKLASAALLGIQKLLAHDLVGPAGLPALTQALEQVERLREEGVQLKLLQTTLTFMQSPLQAQSEEGVAAVLGICFRLLADPKNSDTVVNTAAATVRQAVALVFENVGVKPQLAAPPDYPDGEPSPEARGPASPGASPARSPEGSPRPRRAFATTRVSGLLADHGPANAALKLLDELCMMVTANAAMLNWLRAPLLPRAFVLDLLDFVLGHSAPVFRGIPAFEHALLVRVCLMLTTQLQNLLDPACEPALQAAELRVVLRVVRTVLRLFHRQLSTRCGVFLESLLAGTGGACTLWQRINVMQVLRSLMGAPPFVHFVFVTYDLQPDCKLPALARLVAALCGTVAAALGAAGAEGVEEDPVVALAALYHTRATNSKEWTLDTGFSAAPLDTGVAYLSMLATDALLAVVAAAEALTDAATGERGAAAAAPPGGGAEEGPGASLEECAALMEALWRPLLGTLGMLLARCSGETLNLLLLRGYQSFTQACGVLGAVDPRDAFLRSLCALTLSDAGGAEVDTPGGPGSPGAQDGQRQREGGAGSTPGGKHALETRPTGKAAGAHAAANGPLGEAGVPAVEGPGHVLTPKNVQALRTLFNIAHRLAASLGPAWVLVLGTLDALDRILHSPRTTTQEVSSGGAAGGLPSDLAILAVAADQLFESTPALPTAAVVDVLLGLRAVSADALPTAVQQPGPPKLFALARMVSVLLHNPTRIHSLWPIFLDHCQELLASPRPPLRAAAIDALSRAINGTLTALEGAPAAAALTPAPPEGPAEAPSNEAEAAEERQRSPTAPGLLERTRTPGGLPDRGATEHVLLAALEGLYGDAGEPDVQLGLLRATLTLLQRHGEGLGPGWAPVLRLLEGAARRGSAEAVAAAFQSMQLIATDHLSGLPLPTVRAALTVATHFARQQADVNVSLTAVSMVWSAVDLLSGLSTAEGGAVTPQDQEDLLRLLLSGLQAISLDARPEVRHSGVRTLLAVAVGQGGKLGLPAWQWLLWDVLFPLLRSTHHLAATSSREEAAAEVLGRVRGEAVSMLVHHSRNSAQKQWEETLVLLLGGLGRLLRAHLPRLAPLPGFGQGWEELMAVVESSLAGGSGRDVALAATGLITAVLCTHAGEECLSQELWRRGLRAVSVGVEAAAASSCCVPLMARLELVNAIGQLNGALSQVEGDEEVVEMWSWVERLARNPLSDDEAGPAVPGTLPPVQKGALALLGPLAPADRPHLWPQFIALLLRLVRPQQVAAALARTPAAQGPQSPAEAASGAAVRSLEGNSAAAAAEANGGPGPRGNNGLAPAPQPAEVAGRKQNVNRHALTSLSMSRVLELLADLFRDKMPPESRAACLASVAQCLAQCMAVRYVAYEDGLWRAACRAYIQVVESALPALDTHPPPEDAERQPWPELLGAFSSFLLPDPAATASAAGSAEGEQPPVPQETGPLPSAHSTPRQLTEDERERRSNSGASGGAPGDTPGGPRSARTPRPSRGEPPGDAEDEGARADAELEAAVLDLLTDTVLTGCTSAPPGTVRGLVGVVDGGTVRPRVMAVPRSAAGSRFSQLCLRKLYLLASLGGGAASPRRGAPEDCLLRVAHAAAPVYVARLGALLGAHARAIAAGREGTDRLALDELLCGLDTAAAAHLAPPVARELAASSGLEALQAVAAALARAQSPPRRWRTHLLVLYGALVRCVPSREPRVRAALRELLARAGQEAGLVEDDPGDVLGA